MKNLKLGFLAILLAFVFQGFGQDNVFLDRKFWDTKPDVKTVKTKMEEGHNPAEANGNNFDGVVYATLQEAPLKTITYLLSQKGNDVNKLTHDGRTYIFWAAYKGNEKLVKYLLKKGAKTDITDDKGNTIINFAAGAGQKNTAVYDLLIKSNSKLITRANPNGANAILLAAPSDNDFKLTDYFQSKGLDINSKDTNGNGIFNYAAKTGNIEMMTALLDKGIKGTDQAFIFAANGARGTTNGIEVYKFLKKVGLSPIVVNNEGVSPLHIVAKRNTDFEVINYLFKNGLDVNALDDNGNNAVMNAASGNSLEVVKHLSRNLKSTSTINKKGQSALTLAIVGNAADVVGFLIKNGYKTDILDAKGNNLAYYLIDSYSPRRKKTFYEKLELLQANNVDLSKVQKNGNTWFHLAVEKNSLDVLELALKMNQDINAKNKEGNTALHLAALKATDDAILKFLIKHGAKKDLVTDFEESAYDLAKENELLKKNNIAIEFLK
ncbi:ankyrin repeat domain-containing protein [Winogradskyella psychrotolerans]|uniref:ankyrin repeat domain-containing protein n=1 Tax=Winogradskyella psychrotolerans TaxID=1344585 RepID=UPI001C079800|nr:ankyrin repeat domain-containing protein [Winogradskyella psychrotolerans]MBU2929931.1 ankyrin repeat domain-containing protein [Winogradskyella psychrotolerans]